MPKQSKAKKTVAKKSDKKVVLAHPKGKPKSKLKLKASSQIKAESTPVRGFLWQVLERKQEEQKRIQQERTNENEKANPLGRLSSHQSGGFGRFHGPRRRVG